jgi:Flp pilus assembly protein TadB
VGRESDAEHGSDVAVAGTANDAVLETQHRLDDEAQHHAHRELLAVEALARVRHLCMGATHQQHAGDAATQRSNTSAPLLQTSKMSERSAAKARQHETNTSSRELHRAVCVHVVVVVVVVVAVVVVVVVVVVMMMVVAMMVVVVVVVVVEGSV